MGRFLAIARVNTVVGFMALAIVASLTGRPAIAETITIGYIGQEHDPAYERIAAYTNLQLFEKHPAIDGAKLAIRESRVIGRSVGMKFQLAETMIGQGGDATAAVRRMIEEQAISAAILDLPFDSFVRTAAALRDEPVLLFNVRHGNDELRGVWCAPRLFHTLPSDAMRMDALLQYLRSRNWNRALMLVGEEEEDRRLGAVFRASARKFGIDIADERVFVLSNDPRQRDHSNIRLMTAGTYDFVFVADSSGEFGRYLPYQTYHPRPIVGTEGLISEAWHWTSERYGAPQLNQRFDKRAKRRMTAEDWAAWAAVRSFVEAVVRGGKTDIDAIAATLTADDFRFDAYKGFPTNYRTWDRQLRQPIMLHSHNAVIAFAPIEGFLHQHNTLDSLGIDESETSCGK